jgi:hypothetical protein
MQWANVEQATFRKSADPDVIVNRVRTRSVPLPAWLLRRLPSRAPHVFSASELDAIGLKAAFSQPNTDA